MIEWEHLDIFCRGDFDFFDPPARIHDLDSRLSAAKRRAPEGWIRTEQDLWVRLHPQGRDLPDTGWKIHVSATPRDADRVCDIVWQYCVAHGLAFKFLRSARAVNLLSAKYADRAASGKAIAIYPATEAELTGVIEELGSQLAGTRGPFVLSDLRIGDGPLFVRYGAFKRLTCLGPDGEPVLARREPDGSLVPDVRDPAFTLPEGIPVPAVLRPHLEALDRDEDIDFPFTVEKAVHYSNSGGVYLAVDALGEAVVLVEARPLAGLDSNGRDSVQRLRVQNEMLKRLEGLPCVPQLLGYHTAWEHHFLVEELVEGLSLFDEMVRRYPYAHWPSGPTKEVIQEYASWAGEITEKLAEALDQIHARGVRFGDLHPSNVIVRPDGQIVLVDYEYARDIDDTTVIDGGAPGFFAFSGLSGAEADRFQLECIRIWLHLPMNLRPEHTPRQLDRAIETVQDLFHVGDEFADSVPLSLEFGRKYSPDAVDALLCAEELDYQAIRDSLVNGILESADFTRTGALFPGSPRQFATGGHTLAHGAAGVLLALHRAGTDIPEPYIDWLVAESRRSDLNRPGLYDGLHGVAHVLDLLGDAEGAEEVIARARPLESNVATAGLLSGKAGIGLHLLSLAERLGNSELFEAALNYGKQLMTLVRAGKDTDDLRWPSAGGLMRGMSGVALFLLHLHEATDDEAFLDHAFAALRHDFARGAVVNGDSFHLIDHGTRQRYLLYLDGGSGGFAMVANDLLKRRSDVDLETAVAAVRAGCRAPFVRNAGLFDGRAGFMATLVHLQNPEDETVIRDHVRRLALHAQVYQGYLTFPGAKLLRLSMDLATGSAGILLALHSAFGGDGRFLPFLDHAVPSGTTSGGRR